MTVPELIAYLEKLPKDTVIGVVYRYCSDYEVLNEEDLTFCEDSSIGPSRVYRKDNKRYVLRQGRIMEYDPKTWDVNEGTPHFVPVLVFPGN